MSATLPTPTTPRLGKKKSEKKKKGKKESPTALFAVGEERDKSGIRTHALSDHGILLRRSGLRVILNVAP